MTVRPPVRPRSGLRRWSVRHARLLEWLYEHFETILLRGLRPLWNALRGTRAEKGVIVVEQGVKGLLFDCRMCGSCVLIATGMSCPMTCLKGLRNGPCGGVRADGSCELDAEQPCAWVLAWDGNQRMRRNERIAGLQAPLDHSRRGTSSWLNKAAEWADDGSH
ncbi:MAG: methylenetetrahydrofolate reductase C-terminal domain-containing protein [Alphaproteobacteria bacterium]|nr:methylenetetrahydrofolate reductase C-terminal domain-containing protein [Alphaproteobacteria bacterium]